MVNCKACGKEIAKGVKKCPHCGKDQRNFFMRYKIITGILVIVLLIGIGGDDELSSSVITENTETIKTTEDAVKNNSEVSETSPKENVDQVEQKEDVKEKSVPREYKAALDKAEIYSDTMYMSKVGIYKQLISEYGEGFPEEAAQYAIDNIVTDWKRNALEKARIYADEMSMSDSSIYEQLISEHGEGFTKEEAQYAIDNL